MEKFKTVVEPKNKLLDLKVRETWKYRDLIWLFVKRDFVTKYKQTLLGPLWAIIQPVFTTLVFTFIFGALAGLPSFDVPEMENYFIPSFLFFMTGNICWAYMSSVITATSNTFIGNASIMGKVYYPRLVTPIANTISQLISFFIQFILFVIVLLIYALFKGADITFTPMLFMFPLVVLEMMMFSMGIGIIISSLTTKYRDLVMVVGFGLSLLQYASPVAYGLTMVTQNFNNAWWMPIYKCNPITNVITTFRYGFFGNGYFNLTYYLIGWAITIFVFFIGAILFNRIEKTFMDTV